MNRSTLGATLFLCAFFSGISSGAQETRSLKTADTQVRFENTAGGPHLLDLKTNDGQFWSNRAVETLPATVELDGKQIAVEWNLSHGKSSSEAHRVAYVYESASPKLRMTWEWIARADYGPIEHRVKIENLDSRLYR